MRAPDLFGGSISPPEGLDYRSDLVSTSEEAELVARLAALPFRAFEFQGYLGKRRVVSFGWHYDFTTMKLGKTAPIPDFLSALRERAAHFAGLTGPDLEHVLITEYGPGAGIGWHKDRGVFGEVVGISLLAACTFRLRLKEGTRWRRFSLAAAPRSIYVLRGPARTQWEHSIPPVEHLRYSLTFRRVREKGSPILD